MDDRSCRMNRSLPEKAKKRGKDITGRKKGMKQELVEFRAFRYNPWTADAKGVFCLQLYKFSAFQKTNHKKEKTTAENNCGKRVGGIECSPLLRTRGRSAEEGRGSLLLKGRWWGCLQVRDPASAPALASATPSNEAVLFRTSQPLPSGKQPSVLREELGQF